MFSAMSQVDMPNRDATILIISERSKSVRAFPLLEDSVKSSFLIVKGSAITLVEPGRMESISLLVVLLLLRMLVLLLAS